MKINIDKVPFSRYGSYLAFSQKDGCRNIDMRILYGGKWNDPYTLFRLFPVKEGKVLSFEVEASPWLLVMKTTEGNIEIYVKGSEGAVIRGNGVSLLLEPADERMVQETVAYDSISLNFHYKNIDTWCYMQTIAGSIAKEEATEVERILIQPQGQTFTLYLETSLEQKAFAAPTLDMKSDIRQTKTEYTEWAQAFGEWPQKYAASAEIALYLLWSSVVAPKGYITRNALLMSKSRMHYIWSWDHCFNALALIDYHPGLAWDQLMVLLDNQMENGALPDRIGAKNSYKGSTKPPIHGWCAQKILDTGFEPEKMELEACYKKLTQWTEWWFRERDDDKDGICQYNKGVESGWDNGSTFDEALPVESPDLSAFLLLQMSFLENLAEKLGKNEEAKEWRVRYHQLMDAFLNQLWTDDGFVTVYGPEHRVVNSQSFLNHIPIVLGEQLPKQYFDKLVKMIEREGHFLTPKGIATESLESGKYKKTTQDWKGSVYWRGCIWAPVIYLVADGLRRGGAMELVKEISRRYCEMLNNSDGFYENYDAVSGVGYDDPGYSWTVCVFTMLIKEFLDKNFEGEAR